MEIRSDAFWLKAITPNLAAGYFCLKDSQDYQKGVLLTSVLYKDQSLKKLLQDITSLKELQQIVAVNKLFYKNIRFESINKKIGCHFSFELIDNCNFYSVLTNISNVQPIFSVFFSSPSGKEYIPVFKSKRILKIS